MADPPELDPLAETATSAPSIPAAQAPGGPGVPRTLGRYQIDGVLGSGAMGVVYAARDPDLDRRIALKVLKGAGSAAARARLLREARAMARLSHPNVVTVHEVGTDDGVDYVAMEMIDGSTVGEWFRAAPRAPAEILEAFETAGRGLAAAHAAGLVHRDFKPHNVLRSKRGRVVVTDFGLARVALDDPAPAAAPGGPDRAVEAASLSSTLTATGALLGTPAYMAPEQQDLGEVGPAADQFSYCVALWEALAGARPFPGLTMGELRAQIERGPDPATEARIPRRLRRVLRRGLAVDPRARFPTMEALLAALRLRRRRAWLFGGAAVVIASLTAVVVVAMGGAPAVVLPGCGDPDRELAGFSAPAPRARLAGSAAGAETIAVLDGVAREWREVQREVCARRGDPELRRRATCLDAVRADLEVTLAAAGRLAPADLADADPALLVGDPVACRAARPPQRVITGDPREIEMAALALMPEDARATVPDPGPDQPCLRVGWRLAQVRGRGRGRRHADAVAELAAAIDEAGRCGDDRTGAMVTIHAVSLGGTGMIRAPGEDDRLRTAVDRAGGDRVVAALAGLIGAVRVLIDDDRDGFLARGAPAVEAAEAVECRRLAALFGAVVAGQLVDRGAPGDRDRARAVIERLLPRAGQRGAGALLRALYRVHLHDGRLDDAHRAAARIVDPPEPPPDGAIAAAGRVIDAAGQPVAGARVVAASALDADSGRIGPTLPRDQVATTGPDGRFALAAVAPPWIVMAEHAGSRSRPAPVGAAVELVLRPTGAVSGRVVRATEGLGQIEVAAGPVPSGPPAATDRLAIVGAVAADGTWRIDGVPYGKARISVEYGPARRRAVKQADVVIGARPAGPVELEAGLRGHTVHAIVRVATESELSAVVVGVVRGRVALDTFGELVTRGGDLLMTQSGPTRADDAPAATRGQLRPGDAVATIDGVEPGEVTACGVGIPGNIMDDRYRERVNQHILAMAVGCVTFVASAPDQVIVVEVPPMKRLPEP